MPKLHRLLLPLLLIVVWLAGLGLAQATPGDFSDGTLSYDATIIANDGWAYSATTMYWRVTELEDVRWQYEYTLTVPNGGTDAISHLIIETSDDFGVYGWDIYNVSAEADGASVAVTWETQTFNGTGGSNPGMPEGIYGVKFEEDLEEDLGGSLGNVFHVTFWSWRDPIWGDFYAVDGKTDPVAYAYNAGFTSGDSGDTDPDPDASTSANHIRVPDTEYGGQVDGAPELGTWLLLGCTGVFGAAVRRRRKR